MYQLIISIISVLFLNACGIEDYPYLGPVGSENISVNFNSRAEIRLPSRSPGDSFINYVLYYRLYVSIFDEPGTIYTGIMNSIHSSLLTDYSYLSSYTNTDSTSVLTTTPSTFSNRNYYQLELRGIDNSGLDKDYFGRTLILDFNQTPGMIPKLVVNNDSYLLLRANGEGVFNPVPSNRYFLNEPDLNAFENATAQINADVAGTQDAGKLYVYMSIYIVATGINWENVSPVFSSPTFVGVLRLPEPTGQSNPESE
ncbi:MAG: hypothetical protein LBQ77_08710 [Treponema sp.]|jgi:hypothetical protein|nr:hypothetical protein [Treponema sp.]